MRHCWTIVATALCLLGGGAAMAASVELFPVRIDLSIPRATATVKVRNLGGDRVTMEVRVVAWRQMDGQDIYEPTRAVLASPPVFEIPPGREQIVRFGLRAQPATTNEESYRVFLQELPDPDEAHGRTVQTLLRIGVPLFVNAAGSGTPSLDWSARREGRALVLDAHNGGDSHARVHALAVGEAGQALQPLSIGGYVLPGSIRRFIVRNPPVAVGAKTLTIEAQTEDGTQRTSVPIR